MIMPTRGENRIERRVRTYIYVKRTIPIIKSTDNE